MSDALEIAWLDVARCDERRAALLRWFREQYPPDPDEAPLTP